jgi:hypothetical protein
MGHLLTRLTELARARGMNDSQWAAAAGLPKETLSRLRRRTSCDFATLSSLARAAGARFAVEMAKTGAASSTGHFPQQFDRDDEARLVALAASGTLDPDRWRSAGPPFFVAGLAVMLASVRDSDRHGLLNLAETLHPGSSTPEVFQLWLDRSPVKPSRFVPMLDARQRHAA